MKKRAALCLTLALALSSLSACAPAKQQASPDAGEPAASQDRLSIVTTIFPQYDFTRQIVQEQADVTMLLKPGSESHSYEPTPQDIKTIGACDLFIYTGGENDVWVESILDSMGDSRPDTLRLVDCVPTVSEELVEGMEHGHDHDHGHADIEEADIQDRPLSDFLGDYQSVLPCFRDGTLDRYISEQAAERGKSFEDMKQAFLQSKASDYDAVSIGENRVSFTGADGPVSGTYAYAGFRTVTDEDGGITGVWYTYQLQTPTDDVPVYLACSDHRIGSSHDGHDGHDHEEHEDHEDDELYHMHLRYGSDSIDALMEAEGWSPTYFPAHASADEIAGFLQAHSHHSDQEEIDEHVWTAPANAIQIVEAISDRLCQKDAAHADAYRANAEDYTAQLKALDASFREVVESAAGTTILFGDRFPFRYLADAYGLQYYAAFSGCSSDSEASASTVAFLIDKVKELKLPVVFTIELSSGKIADSICQATGAEKRTLYACHNITSDQLAEGATYLSLMTENVESLRAALNG